MGTSVSVSDKDMTNYTKKQMINMLEIAMAGRAAEDYFFEDKISTKSSDDLTRANRMAMYYLRKMGMKDESVFVSADKKDLSDELNFKIEKDRIEILKNAYKEISKVVSERSGEIKKLAGILCERETLNKKEVEEIVNISSDSLK